MVAGLLTAAFVGSATACSCYPGSGQGEAAAYLRADHVFVGVVLSETLEGNNPDISYDDQYRYRVKSGTEYKGDVPRRVDILTSTSGAACGIRLTVGTEYLIFAHGSSDDGAVESQYCSGTRLASAGPPISTPTQPTTTTPTTTCSTATP
ncbi:hypothetical protein GCM10027184_04550 [Saccharothrix stipae]